MKNIRVIKRDERPVPQPPQPKLCKCRMCHDKRRESLFASHVAQHTKLMREALETMGQQLFGGTI